MDKVLIISSETNRSAMEKCHLMTKGLEKAGVKTHSIGFCDALDQKEYLDEMFLPGESYTFEYGSKRKLYQGSNYVTKLLNNIYMLLRHFLVLVSYVAREKVSFIIIPAQPFEATFPTFVVAKLFRVKVITNIMEYYPVMPSFKVKKNILIRWSWHLVTKQSKGFIVISDFLYEKIHKLTNKKQLILPAILPDADNASSEISCMSNNIPLLIYTSSSGYTDLLGFVLEALAKIKDKHFEFVITGKYPDNQKHQWLEKIDRLGLSGKARFSGLLSEYDLLEIQKKSDALLIPLLDNDRHKARFPQKVLGYMQLGKPVISTRVGEIASYFHDGDTAIMDESVTVNGFSEKISEVLDNPEIAREIGTRGKKYVEDFFNMEKWGRELKSFLYSL